MRVTLLFFCALVFAVIAVLTAWPQADLWVSSLFTNAGGFVFDESLILRGMTKTVFYAARLMAVFFFIAAIIAWRLPPSFAGRDGKAWVFLLLCLLLGPGLMANVVFKDHWGRARPRDIAAFGGPQSFTPAFAVSKACTRNCSFVSGDGAFGFFLPSFAYGAARGKRKRVFWGAMALGGVIGAGRIVMGAHFLSDVLCAMVISLAVSAALHALFYGTHATKACWNDWLFFKKTA